VRALLIASAASLLAAGAFAAAMLGTRGYTLHTTPPPAVAAPEAYVAHCAPCHGLDGDGGGPSAEGMRPPPRDFRSGEFKFTRTGYGTLPSDAALEHTIRDGLNGTPMQGWALRPTELAEVIAYLKTRSARWKTEPVPPEVEVSPDPWQGRTGEALAAGEQAYHALGCASCHPSYAPPSLDRVALKDSAYAVKVLPISFRVHALKSGSTREDIYRVIACGVGGAAMPGWKGMLSEDQLWSIAYYVESLAAQRR
jgi:mono/diheme cytochrome c family protein